MVDSKSRCRSHLHAHHERELRSCLGLPGPGTVFIGDTVTAQAEVLSVHATKPVTQRKVIVTRQDGETVLEGEAWRYTLHPEELRLPWNSKWRSP